MEQLQHFSHDHLLSLVHMKWNQDIENSDEEDGDDFVGEDQLGGHSNMQRDQNKDNSEEEVGVDFVMEEEHHGKCNMCNEMIYSFHLCYYKCKECDYMLHKFCAELPTTIENHPFHPGHSLTLSEIFQDVGPSDSDWMCGFCNLKWKMFFNYHCSVCKFNMDIICATMAEQKMDHPSHPHQLQRILKPMVTLCTACGDEHKGDFYHCAICPWFYIHLDCALLPAKLQIQKPTDNTFAHSHPLTLVYSFPKIEMKAKFDPHCRVCDEAFYAYFWLYKCEKCRYYVHVKCASSKIEPFMSILLPAGLGKTFKNFKDDDHPDLLRCPFPDESYNLLKHHYYNQKDIIFEENGGKNLNRSSHQHPLILIDAQTSLRKKSISLHDPMKKIQLLCDGCVKPITAVPFYKCSEDVQSCGFVLHEWCTKLPFEVLDHPGHPKHKLVLLSKIPSKFFGVFWCNICMLPSNGFAYGCTTCDYYVDINCAFLPKEITHEAHPDHLLSRINASTDLSGKYCKACTYYLEAGCSGFHCPSCNFFLHTKCAFLLPRMIRHKHDKDPLTLRYYPVENHISEYFCEICEDEFDPEEWFYHCTTCVQSMHTACMPLILQCEQDLYYNYKSSVYEFLNVKFGGKLKMEGHPHLLSFVQGIESDGECIHCEESLRYKMIFKCLECKHAIHHGCASWYFD